ncbi:hypothetical protein DW66_4715 [Pseudomonas putida]|nr:hypothetical protein DW66_4715 [Pseudomonas putida]
MFLVAGRAVTTVAVAAWEEPKPTVFSKAELADQCALPREMKLQQQAEAAPDQDLLLFLFGMRQGLRPFG